MAKSSALAKQALQSQTSVARQPATKCCRQADGSIARELRNQSSNAHHVKLLGRNLRRERYHSDTSFRVCDFRKTADRKNRMAPGCAAHVGNITWQRANDGWLNSMAQENRRQGCRFRCCARITAEPTNCRSPAAISTAGGATTNLAARLRQPWSAGGCRDSQTARNRECGDTGVVLRAPAGNCAKLRPLLLRTLKIRTRSERTASESVPSHSSSVCSRPDVVAAHAHRTTC